MLTPRVLKGSLSVIYIYMSEELYYMAEKGNFLKKYSGLNRKLIKSLI